jgi:CheY-like chemotaxis protein
MVQQTQHILLIAATESICKNDLLTSTRQANNSFLFAITGQEAIDVCMQHPEVELILIDIDLPVINGIETIRRIKQLDANIPVVLLVTYITLETMRLAQNIGCNEILQTPVDQNTIEAIILNYLPFKAPKINTL